MTNKITPAGGKRKPKESIETELLREMVTKLNAGLGGPLAPWFAIWRDRAEKFLSDGGG